MYIKQIIIMYVYGNRKVINIVSQITTELQAPKLVEKK